MERYWMLTDLLPNTPIELMSGSPDAHAEVRGMSGVVCSVPSGTKISAGSGRVPTFFMPVAKMDPYKHPGTWRDAGYTPLAAQLVDARAGRYPVIVAGSEACGKTTYCTKLVDVAHRHGYEAHHIDLRVVINEVLADARYVGTHDLPRDSVSTGDFGRFSEKWIAPVINRLQTRVSGLTGIIFIEVIDCWIQIYRHALSDFGYTIIHVSASDDLVSKAARIKKQDVDRGFGHIWRAPTDAQENTLVERTLISARRDLPGRHVCDVVSLDVTAEFPRVLNEVDILGTLRITRILEEYRNEKDVADTVAFLQRKYGSGPRYFHNVRYIAEGLSWQASNIQKVAWLIHPFMHEINSVLGVINRRSNSRKLMDNYGDTSTLRSLLSLDLTDLRVLSAHDHRQRLHDMSRSIFAAPESRYLEYVRDVRREHAHLSDEAYRRKRVDELQGLLAHNVFTGVVPELSELSARENIGSELEILNRCS